VLAELLEKAGEGDFLRAVAEAVLQLLMETDVEGMIWWPAAILEKMSVR
jgi:putative transposase